MATLQVFDRPMCCSTGICGPSVDFALVQFAADLAWLREQGVEVERYNLAQQPQEFFAYEDVKAVLREPHALPLVRVNGRIVRQGSYPSRSMLAEWCGITTDAFRPVADAAACCRTSCCC